MCQTDDVGYFFIALFIEPVGCFVNNQFKGLNCSAVNGRADLNSNGAGHHHFNHVPAGGNAATADNQ